MNPVNKVRSQQKGFTLLEAIVAMVLISGAGYALLGWINNNITALYRIQEVNARSEATSNILEYMRNVNPMLTPEGKVVLGQYRISWLSKQSAAVVDQFSSDYKFALYNSTINVEDANNKAWFTLNLRQVGYQKVRFPPTDL